MNTHTCAGHSHSSPAHVSRQVSRAFSKQSFAQNLLYVSVVAISLTIVTPGLLIASLKPPIWLCRTLYSLDIDCSLLHSPDSRVGLPVRLRAPCTLSDPSAFIIMCPSLLSKLYDGSNTIVATTKTCHYFTARRQQYNHRHHQNLSSFALYCLHGDGIKIVATTKTCHHFTARRQQYNHRHHQNLSSFYYCTAAAVNKITTTTKTCHLFYLLHGGSNNHRHHRNVYYMLSFKKEN